MAEVQVFPRKRIAYHSLMSHGRCDECPQITQSRSERIVNDWLDRHRIDNKGHHVYYYETAVVIDG